MRLAQLNATPSEQRMSKGILLEGKLGTRAEMRSLVQAHVVVAEMNPTPCEDCDN